MHRGSSKGARAARAPETLPLSASPPTTSVHIRFEILRGGASRPRDVVVAAGTLLRTALREIGLAPEGCAVLRGDRPLPLDTPLDRPETLSVVPTFSGG